MPSYILRHIDPELWAKVKARAQVDEMPLKGVILKLLALYASGELVIRANHVE